jgi:ABC-type molybdate transport system substrate-binding protein
MQEQTKMADQSTHLKVMCALAIRQAFDQVIVPDLAAAGVNLEIDWNPTTVIMKTIASGGRADALVIMTEAMDELAAQGIIDPTSRFEVVQSRVGIAVPKGAPHPDIATVDAFGRHCSMPARSPIRRPARAASISATCWTSSGSPTPSRQGPRSFLRASPPKSCSRAKPISPCSRSAS